MSKSKINVDMERDNNEKFNRCSIKVSSSDGSPMSAQEVLDAVAESLFHLWKPLTAPDFGANWDA